MSALWWAAIYVAGVCLLAMPLQWLSEMGDHDDTEFGPMGALAALIWPLWLVTGVFILLPIALLIGASWLLWWPVKKWVPRST